MIHIEVTGQSIGEVADKLLAIGASLQGSRNPVMPEVAAATTGNVQTQAKRNTKAAKEGPVVGEPAPSAAETTVDTAAGTKEATGSGTATSTAPVETADAPALDFDKDISPAVTGAVAKKGKPAVVEIIGQFGVARASEVPEERWPELLELLK